MARTFNGTSQYAKLADSATHSLPNGDWTIAMWVRPTSLSGFAYQFLYSHNYSSVDNYAALFINDVDNSMVADVGRGTGEGYVYVYTAANAVVVNTWAHWIFSRESGYLRLFKNAVLQAEFAPATFLGCNPATDVYFACRDNVSTYFPGNIAEIARWNRALRSDEKTGLLKMSPSYFPTSLLWHVTLMGQEAVERRLSLPITFNATPGVYDSPPLIVRP